MVSSYVIRVGVFFILFCLDFSSLLLLWVRISGFMLNVFKKSFKKEKGFGPTQLNASQVKRRATFLAWKLYSDGHLKVELV